LVKEGSGCIARYEAAQKEVVELKRERDEAIEGYLIEKGHREQAETEIQRLLQLYKAKGP
jgi:hypothetical protein